MTEIKLGFVSGRGEEGGEGVLVETLEHNDDLTP